LVGLLSLSSPFFAAGAAPVDTGSCAPKIAVVLARPQLLNTSQHSSSLWMCKGSRLSRTVPSNSVTSWLTIV
jgi:hypothetical protein